jgi:hypothetical protein
MFSLAYVIRPVSGLPPAGAIRAALAPFQRGTRVALAESSLAFHDETGALRETHEAHLVFREKRAFGMRV